MCGIAGTVFNKEFLQGEEVTVSDLRHSIENEENNPNFAEELLEQAWKYKSNINFLRFCKDSTEKHDLQDLCITVKKLADKKREEIANIDKSISLEPYKNAVKACENIMDTHWFLSKEIYRWVQTIEEISNSEVKKLDNSTIILYKSICTVIHAIDNRLELRGRDSFGLSIAINAKSSHDNIQTYSFNNSLEESYYLYDNFEYHTHTFTFKTCNSIGSLGDNAREIKKLLRHNQSFNKLIQNEDVKSATIMAHTRWASVGAVNVENAHPANLIDNTIDNGAQTLALLNGDIYNYKEIINDANKTYSDLISSSLCTNDSLAIPAYLLNKDQLDLDTTIDMASNFSGSFAISIQHSSNAENITLLKKGIQGLYLGFSYDGIIFASDVYGLVETCRYFMPVESDTAMNISAVNCSSVNNIMLQIMDHRSNTLKLITKNQLQITNITTRDIDKRGYEHFLKKEIYETSDIVERTINGYLQPPMAIDLESLNSTISMNNNQVPDFIIASLQRNEIKKVIITGMGTCYTAAVAISMYMRSRLKLFMPDIIVEPHVASEGSAFYIEPNMQDTLVIVIAQSGTTVDTNVYVQMAKERGAMSLAIANKREGDVTFIVDGTIYIGEGRDIEVAVPSTKTYTAQVILGYILTLYFASNLLKTKDEKDTFISDLSDLRCTNNLISESFDVLNKTSFEHINNQGQVNNSWYVLRDSSSNGVCADELRIKYSENCYQSVSSLTLSEAIRLNIKKSFITLISERPLSELENDILKLTENKNSLTLIVIDSVIPDNLIELEASGQLAVINMPRANTHFSFLPTVIAGQFLSYYLALSLDERKKYFIDLKESLLSKDKMKIAYFNLQKAISSGLLNQGFSAQEIKSLIMHADSYIKDNSYQENASYLKLSNHLESLIQYSRRTIDTIKHQAKTITVGAVRESMQDQQPLVSLNMLPESSAISIDDTSLLKDIYSSFEENYKNKNDLNFDEVIIAYEDLDEAYAYNIVNFINDFLTQVSVDKKVRLAHDYDYPTENKKSSAFWVVLSASAIIQSTSYLKFLDESQYMNPCLSDFSVSSNISSNFYLDDSQKGEYFKAIWSLFLSLFLSNKFSTLASQGSLIKKVNFEVEKNLHSLISSIETIKTSSQIKSSTLYAVKQYLSRTNWKCIGSGTNYNLSKFTSKLLTAKINRACAFDVLENHKHIDMSAESAIIVFISNIWKHGYQEDAFSEIEKLISHNSLPIIITNEGDERFDNFSISIRDDEESIINSPISIIKMPKLSQQYAFSMNILFAEKFVDSMIAYTSSEDGLSNIQVATQTPQGSIV